MFIISSILAVAERVSYVIYVWSTQDATYSGSTDELVDENLLLKDFLVCYSSHILRPHFDERITNELNM